MLFQFLSSSEDVDLHLRKRKARNVCYLIVIVSFIVAEKDHAALNLWKRVERFVQYLLQIVASLVRLLVGGCFVDVFVFLVSSKPIDDLVVDCCEEIAFHFGRIHLIPTLP